MYGSLLLLLLQSNRDLCLLNGPLPVSSVFLPLNPIRNLAFINMFHDIHPCIYGSLNDTVSQTTCVE